MNLIDLFFRLLADFSPIENTKQTILKEKALGWYVEQLEKGKVEGAGGMPKLLSNYGEIWWMQIVFAFAYIPLKIWLNGMMHPEMGDQGDTRM